MSRIRSIHPGLYTDEVFASLSMAARVFLPGLWTEADDHGVFEWKPLTLKMKIFPADNVDVSTLLGELIAADAVKRVEIEGKHYGIIRNFGRYQRPKNPAYKHPLPEEYRTYSGHKQDNSPSPPPVLPQSSPSNTEKSPQRKEEGGKMEDEEEEKGARKRATRLPSDWVPNEIDFEFAHSKGLPHREIATEAQKFANYWTAKSGRDATKLDWPATWRNWILNAVERKPNGKTHGKVTLAARALELADQVRDREIAAGLGRPDASFGRFGTG